MRSCWLFALVLVAAPVPAAPAAPTAAQIAQGRQMCADADKLLKEGKPADALMLYESVSQSLPQSERARKGAAQARAAIAAATATPAAPAAAPSRPASAAPPVSVAILPFQQLTPRDDDQYLQAGFAETLTTALSRVGGIRLIERGQLKRIADELKLQQSGLVDPTTAVKIGNLTGARRLVLGSFQRAGRVMRVTCRIVDTESGVIDAGHAITETRDLAQDADLFTLQDAVCEALLKTFSVTPTTQEQHLVQQVVTATPSVTAYTYYVQAREQYLLFTIEGYTRALPLFEKALEVDPSYALALAGSAETLSLWGYQKEQNGEDALPDYRRALDLAKKAVSLAPSLADAHRALALVYRRLDVAGASIPASGPLGEEEMRKALALNPLDAEALYMLWATEGKPLTGDGYARLRKALEINPHLSAAWVDLGLAFARQGNLEDAIAAYRQALAINPRATLAYNNLGLALYAQGNTEEAMAALRQATAINPRHAKAHCALGLVLNECGKTQEAITAYRQALAINPRIPEASNGLGVALYAQGKLDDAIAAYRQALAVAPRYATAHYNLGNALADHGNLDEAVTAYRQAIAIHPRHALAYCNLAVSLTKQGRKAEAIDALRRYLALAKEDPAHRDLLPKAHTLLKALGAN